MQACTTSSLLWWRSFSAREFAISQPTVHPTTSPGTSQTSSCGAKLTQTDNAATTTRPRVHPATERTVRD